MIASTSLVVAASTLLDAFGMNLQAQKRWRRQRLLELMDEVGPSALAKITGIAGALLYQMSKGRGKQARNVGDDHVVIIERATERFGWFDFRDSADDLSVQDVQIGRAESPRRAVTFSRRANVIDIPQLDVVASMGLGVDLQEHVEVVRMIQVNLPDLRRVLPSFTAPENLVIITGLGDSMRGTFNDGDPIIVDQGIKEVTVEGVYVLRRDGELFIKRLQRQLDGTLMMISDNPRYPPQHITDDARKAFDVVGRALGVWNFQKF